MEQHISNPVTHLGVIMDGNRRWAKDHNLPSLIGHKRGVETLENVGNWCIARGIKYLTVWAFSAENWNRPEDEISYLMKLMREVAISKVSVFMKKGVKLNILGRLSELPLETQDAIRKAIEKTKNNAKVIMNVAINYGGRNEIVDAVKKIVKEKVKPEKITPELLSSHLYAPEIPDPDLVIRTGGAQRTSGFLLWESHYSEWYFSKQRWPEFSEDELDRAIEDFNGRKRNFGK
jgi:undecaprenyl diphosphate synthase